MDKAIAVDTRRTGGDLVVAGLKRWGIDTMFGVPGVQLDQLFDALSRGGEGIRLIHTRHEQGAAYMALGYAMVTGRPGVCAVVPGPGVLNAGAAIATAYACNARMLCLTSTINSAMLDRRFGALHEINDQSGVLRNLTKWAARASHADEVPGLIDEAFRQLLSGRPQPVALEIPPDILAQLTVGDYPEDRPQISNPPIDATLIAQAAAIAAAAERPMIIVGGGAQGAGAAVRRLAEQLQAPIVSRNMGRGVVDDDDDYALPAAAAIDKWPEVDVVIGIGTRLQILREWGTDARLKVIRIDMDQAEMNRIALPAVGIRADATEGTDALADAIARERNNRPSRTEEIAVLRTAFRLGVARDMAPQMAYVDAIRAAMGEDDVLVDEMTQIAYVARYGFPVHSPRAFVTSSYQGTLGYGFATALGAQVGAGSRRVISINGDGGFMYTMPELATAVLHNIPLIAVVFSDGYFGNVRRIQQGSYGGRMIASVLHNPDFVKLAENFGAVGIRAEGPEALRQAIEKARGINGPVLIEVPQDTDSMPSPWKHIHGRKVR
ncbi:hypothetical protein G4G27_17025 [Sphingomonas sp. So64.6b]|uniref:thiamine pyrophosphate-dependent enzyme n=1 Tax=Sphingomonas sp. So64.6b TaxID=2997354 RepID=UPI001603AA16|nr:thiamine pyrophosphate-dependent enzyme [Sphingomonas sp. So64.6b]QNA85496.1 hypothetical protein G4G27_17025 [Sphingomonas sp. So64.6b]